MNILITSAVWLFYVPFSVGSSVHSHCSVFSLANAVDFAVFFSFIEILMKDRKYAVCFDIFVHSAYFQYTFHFFVFSLLLLYAPICFVLLDWLKLKSKGCIFHSLLVYFRYVQRIFYAAFTQILSSVSILRRFSRTCQKMQIFAQWRRPNLSGKVHYFRTILKYGNFDIFLKKNPSATDKVKKIDLEMAFLHSKKNIHWTICECHVICSLECMVFLFF